MKVFLLNAARWNNDLHTSALQRHQLYGQTRNLCKIHNRAVLCSDFKYAPTS